MKIDLVEDYKVAKAQGIIMEENVDLLRLSPASGDPTYRWRERFQAGGSELSYDGKVIYVTDGQIFLPVSTVRDRTFLMGREDVLYLPGHVYKYLLGSSALDESFSVDVRFMRTAGTSVPRLAVIEMEDALGIYNPTSRFAPSGYSFPVEAIAFGEPGGMNQPLFGVIAGIPATAAVARVSIDDLDKIRKAQHPVMSSAAGFIKPEYKPVVRALGSSSPYFMAGEVPGNVVNVVVKAGNAGLILPSLSTSVFAHGGILPNINQVLLASGGWTHERIQSQGVTGAGSALAGNLPGVVTAHIGAPATPVVVRDAVQTMRDAMGKALAASMDVSLGGDDFLVTGRVATERQKGIAGIADVLDDDVLVVKANGPAKIVSDELQHGVPTDVSISVRDFATAKNVLMAVK